MGGVLPGFISTTGVNRPITVTGFVDERSNDVGGVTLTSWGVAPLEDPAATTILSRVVRNSGGEVPQGEIADALVADPSALARLLPPFAAVGRVDGGVTMVADSMGFRPLFHTGAESVGATVMSTSALLAGWAREAAFDERAVAVQSLLGWQLGQRTIFTGICKLAPGAIARQSENGVSVRAAADPAESPRTIVTAVAQAAALLRRSLSAVLDEYPDAVLQLTGGMDSRILLSAIAPSRRRGMTVMTLGDSTSGDVQIAARIAEQLGLRHEVHGLADVSDLSPATAWEACRTAALQLDGMSDPVAQASLQMDEQSFAQGVRIAGLGGEVARGFFYVGKVQARPVTEREARSLAAWRMFANESVEPGLLDEEFSKWGRDAAENAVFEALSEHGEEWFDATDTLYLRHRMQRWAGVTDTAAGNQRLVINPMLDEEFIRIARSLTPHDKGDARFLASLQLALDPELSRIPLDGRLAPAAYAHPNAWHGVGKSVLLGRKLARKAMQRARGANRAPAGGDLLANKVVAHWRSQPSLLALVGKTGFVRTDWLEGLADGRIQPRPSSVAFLTNLIVASSRTP